ncbi:MAG: hypothetical protein IJM05_04940 [Bacteroidales bacterium]|nr:hypothetical protein [Bacteroidales bacterium]
MKKYYVVTTGKIENAVMFRDDEDFTAGMNYVAIVASRHPRVKVVAFILMSNHVHFVLIGAREDVEAFTLDFKVRYSLYFSRKYGVKGLLKRNKIDVSEIETTPEAKEQAIAYVLMNCVAANICFQANQYPWGTGNIYFNPSRPVGRVLGSMSGREKERLFHTNDNNLPSNWIVSDEGVILPQNYVDVEIVESCFRTPKRMGFFLQNSSKAKKRLETDENLPAFTDQAIIGILPQLYRSLFRKNSFQELRPEEQTELMRQIRFRFSANIHQIARVCGLTYAEATKKIDDI